MQSSTMRSLRNKFDLKIHKTCQPLALVVVSKVLSFGRGVNSNVEVQQSEKLKICKTFEMETLK